LRGCDYSQEFKNQQIFRQLEIAVSEADAVGECATEHITSSITSGHRL
ncbi:MAG: hypothetical protein F6K26_46730, partial [Moorea sp. SIO2I5]|nr:hypothetical protein [Moorena sp. SIO2I5]